MNANDTVVRIERVVGNFPKKERERVVESVQMAIDESAETSKTVGASEPLTSEEISLIRDGLRTGVKTAKPAKTEKTAKK